MMKTLKTKYPKHGSRNVLKWHTGRIVRQGVGKNGPFTVIKSKRFIQTLLECKMIEPVYS